MKGVWHCLRNEHCGRSCANQLPRKVRELSQLILPESTEPSAHPLPATGRGRSHATCPAGCCGSAGAIYINSSAINRIASLCVLIPACYKRFNQISRPLSQYYSETRPALLNKRSFTNATPPQACPIDERRWCLWKSPNGNPMFL